MIARCSSVAAAASHTPMQAERSLSLCRPQWRLHLRHGGAVKALRPLGHSASQRSSQHACASKHTPLPPSLLSSSIRVSFYASAHPPSAAGALSDRPRWEARPRADPDQQTATDRHVTTRWTAFRHAATATASKHTDTAHAKQTRRRRWEGMTRGNDETAETNQTTTSVTWTSDRGARTDAASGSGSGSATASK